jgi:hypothetical protein
VANFARAYTEWASARTGAPPSFHRYAALAVCGAALGNRLFVDMGWGRVYASQWLCLVGRTESHKSTAVNLACSLLGQADQSIELPHDFTREAMYEFLAAKPSGLMRWREMGSVLRSMSREYNAGVLATLTDLWDSPHMTKRRTKGSGEVQITWPAVSIVAAAKPRWFVENISAEDIEGGFVARWLFVTAESGEERPPNRLFGNGLGPTDAYQRDSLVEHLQRLSQHEGDMGRGEGEEAAEAWWKNWQARGWNEDSDPADFSARAGTQVIKLAIALQASKGVDFLGALDPDAVTKAAALYEYAFFCARPLVERMRHHTKSTDEIEKILAFIRSEGGALRRDVYRKFKMKPRDLDDLLGGMIEAELISVERIETDNPGPRPILYKAVR